MRRFLVIVLACTCAQAQWLNYKTAGIPRTSDGKPNLSAPAPRTADGKPDVAGLWQIAGLYVANIAKDLKPGEVPFSTLGGDLVQAASR